jgi:hypothetical protein
MLQRDRDKFQKLLILQAHTDGFSFEWREERRVDSWAMASEALDDIKSQVRDGMIPLVVWIFERIGGGTENLYELETSLGSRNLACAQAVASCLVLIITTDSNL